MSEVPLYDDYAYTYLTHGVHVTIEDARVLPPNPRPVQNHGNAFNPATYVKYLYMVIMDYETSAFMLCKRGAILST